MQAAGFTLSDIPVETTVLELPRDIHAETAHNFMGTSYRHIRGC
jgi:hypothetical protein